MRSIAFLALVILVPFAVHAQIPPQVPTVKVPDPFNGERLFYADLSAANQTVLTESPGVGHAELRVDLATLTLQWTLSFENLTSKAVAAHIHGPAQPGTNAPPILDLAPKGIASPVTGAAPVTESQVQYMLQGWSYIIIQTVNHPGGEIRGKIQVRRPRSIEP